MLAVKHSLEKATLLNLVNLPTIPRQRLHIGMFHELWKPYFDYESHKKWTNIQPEQFSLPYTFHFNV